MPHELLCATGILSPLYHCTPSLSLGASQTVVQHTCSVSTEIFTVDDTAHPSCASAITV